MFLAYHGGFHYYGQAGHDKPALDLRSELRDHDIDYYLVWDPKFSFDAGTKEVTDGHKSGRPRIYRVK